MPVEIFFGFLRQVSYQGFNCARHYRVVQLTGSVVMTLPEKRCLDCGRVLRTCRGNPKRCVSCSRKDNNKRAKEFRLLCKKLELTGNTSI